MDEPHWSVVFASVGRVRALPSSASSDARHPCRGREWGQHAHQLPGETVLQTPWPTVLRHHLIRRSPPLDLPRPGPLAALFLGAVGVMVFVLVPLGALQAVGAQIILFLVLLIPAWSIGFSIPVFIWWAVSSRCSSCKPIVVKARPCSLQGC